MADDDTQFVCAGRGPNIVIGSGIFPEWIESGHEVSFGPTLIPGGALSVSLHRSGRCCYAESWTVMQQAFDGDIIIDVPEYKRQEAKWVLPRSNT